MLQLCQRLHQSRWPLPESRQILQGVWYLKTVHQMLRLILFDLRRLQTQSDAGMQARADWSCLPRMFQTFWAQELSVCDSQLQILQWLWLLFLLMRLLYQLESQLPTHARRLPQVLPRNMCGMFRQLQTQRRSVFHLRLPQIEIRCLYSLQRKLLKSRQNLQIQKLPRMERR